MLKTYVAEAWAGKLPLSKVFWQGALVWMVGFFISTGIAYGTVYWVKSGVFESFNDPEVQALFAFENGLKWLFFFVFIWWCVSVWKCAEAEPTKATGMMAKGVVIALVLGNAISVLT